MESPSRALYLDQRTGRRRILAVCTWLLAIIFLLWIPFWMADVILTGEELWKLPSSAAILAFIVWIQTRIRRWNTVLLGPDTLSHVGFLRDHVVSYDAITGHGLREEERSTGDGIGTLRVRILDIHTADGHTLSWVPGVLDDPQPLFQALEDIEAGRIDALKARLAPKLEPITRSRWYLRTLIVAVLLLLPVGYFAWGQQKERHLKRVLERHGAQLRSDPEAAIEGLLGVAEDDGATDRQRCTAYRDLRWAYLEMMDLDATLRACRGQADFCSRGPSCASVVRMKEASDALEAGDAERALAILEEHAELLRGNHKAAVLLPTLERLGRSEALREAALDCAPEGDARTPLQALCARYAKPVAGAPSGP